jgi:hypothetical protein
MTCVAWIGSGWIAGCVDQLYTNAWICCDEESDNGSGGTGKKPGGFRIGLFEKTIKPYTQPVGQPIAIEAKELEDTSTDIQFEIDRFNASSGLLQAQLDLMIFQGTISQLQRNIAESEIIQLKQGEKALEIVKQMRVDEEEFLIILMLDS